MTMSISITTLLETQRVRSLKEDLVLRSFKDLESDQKKAIFVRLYDLLSDEASTQVEEAPPVPVATSPVATVAPATEKPTPFTPPRGTYVDQCRSLLRSFPDGVTPEQIGNFTGQSLKSVKHSIHYLKALGEISEKSDGVWILGPSKALPQVDANGGPVTIREMIIQTLQNGPLLRKELIQRICHNYPQANAHSVGCEISVRVQSKEVLRIEGPKRNKIHFLPSQVNT